MSARGANEAEGRVQAGTHSPTRRSPGWPVLLPLGVIIVGVIALAVSATAIHYRTQALREETVALINPTRTAAQDLIVSMALETESLYEYAFYGSATSLADYERSAAARQAAARRLRPLAAELNGEPARRTTILLRLVSVWDSMSARAFATARQAGNASAIPADLDALFRQILLEATALQRALSEDNEQARANIDAAEKLDWYFTLGLVLLSLASAVLVIYLVQRIRRLVEISERRRLESETLMEDRARLIRGITHDVKNPLGAADGSAQLLEMGMVGKLSTRQMEAVRRIRRGIGSALSIIAGLLDLSKGERGGLELDLQPTDVTRAIREVVEDYRHQAEIQQVTLNLDVGGRLEPMITDEGKLREIVGNLLSNAIKYTPSGGHVAVGVARQTRVRGERDLLFVSVSDTGPGIPIEEQALVFEEFYRSASSVGRAPGAGLGLAISRRMARLMGGDISVNSVVGEGSTFTLCLPVRAVGDVRHAA